MTVLILKYLARFFDEKINENSLQGFLSLQIKVNNTF